MSDYTIDPSLVQKYAPAMVVGAVGTSLVKWFAWKLLFVSGCGFLVYKLGLHQKWWQEVDFSKWYEKFSKSFNNSSDCVPSDLFTVESIPGLALGALLGFIFL